jgi:hypothetical protein
MQETLASTAMCGASSSRHSAADPVTVIRVAAAMPKAPGLRCSQLSYGGVQSASSLHGMAAPQPVVEPLAGRQVGWATESGQLEMRPASGSPSKQWVPSTRTSRQKPQKFLSWSAFFTTSSVASCEVDWIVAIDSLAGAQSWLTGNAVHPLTHVPLGQPTQVSAGKSGQSVSSAQEAPLTLQMLQRAPSSPPPSQQS